MIIIIFNKSQRKNNFKEFLLKNKKNKALNIKKKNKKKF